MIPAAFENNYECSLGSMSYKSRIWILRIPLLTRQKTGIDFELWYFTLQPSYFVIRKIQRFSPIKSNVFIYAAELLAIYYIVEGTIYQSPTLGHILSNRLLTSLYHINQAFDKAQASARFHPIQGYHWDTDEPAIEKARNEMIKAAKKDRYRPFTAEDQRLARESQQRVEQLLVQSFTDDPKRKQHESSLPMKKIKSQ
jgi:hypothetical protein